MKPFRSAMAGSPKIASLPCSSRNPSLRSKRSRPLLLRLNLHCGPTVIEEIVYTESDAWDTPQDVEQDDFHDAFDGLPLSQVHHDCFGSFAPALDIDTMSADVCAAAAAATDISTKVSFECNAEVWEFPVSNLSRKVMRKTRRPAWLPPSLPLDEEASSDSEHLTDSDAEDQVFHDLPNQDEPGVGGTYLLLSVEHMELLGTPPIGDVGFAVLLPHLSIDEIMTLHLRIRSSLMLCLLALRMGLFKGPIEIHYPIVPLVEDSTDWNWNHMLFCEKKNKLRLEFEVDSLVLAEVCKDFVVQMLGPTRTFYKRECTVVRAHVELTNYRHG
eukprot:2888795-Amphidinium_carterae.1